MDPNFGNASSSLDWTLTDPTATANETFEALGPLGASIWLPFPGQDPLDTQPWYARALALNGTLGWTELEVVDGNINFGGQDTDRDRDTAEEALGKARMDGKGSRALEKI